MWESTQHSAFEIGMLMLRRTNDTEVVATLQDRTECLPEGKERDIPQGNPEISVAKGHSSPHLWEVQESWFRSI